MSYSKRLLASTVFGFVGCMYSFYIITAVTEHRKPNVRRAIEAAEEREKEIERRHGIRFSLTNEFKEDHEFEAAMEALRNRRG